MFSEKFSISFLLLLLALSLPIFGAPTLEKAFIFGSRQLNCEVFNAPGTTYTVVYQGTPQDLSLIHI